MRPIYPCEEHPDYSRWLSMTQRCKNPNNVNYKNYGAKGITIAPEFKDFNVYAEYIRQLDHYGEPDVQLDRIDGTKGYEPGNLRWSSRSVQIANQTSSGKGNNKYTGVCWSKSHNRWVARIVLEGKNLLSSTHYSQRDALEARNNCIRKNKLPHPIQEWVGE